MISADNLDSLQLKKDNLVTDKAPAEGAATPAVPAGLPARPNINLDEILKSAGVNKPADVETDGPAAEESQDVTDDAGETKEPEETESANDDG